MSHCYGILFTEYAFENHYLSHYYGQISSYCVILGPHTLVIKYVCTDNDDNNNGIDNDDGNDNNTDNDNNHKINNNNSNNDDDYNHDNNDTQ